ncbi:MAG: hypothetical protein ACOX4I_05005 [Anaerovoracaceae bacterium]
MRKLNLISIIIAVPLAYLLLGYVFQLPPAEYTGAMPPAVSLLLAAALGVLAGLNARDVFTSRRPGAHTRHAKYRMETGPGVTDVIPLSQEISSPDLLAVAACTASVSDDTPDVAVIREAQKRKITFEVPRDYDISDGHNVCAFLRGRIFFGGDAAFVAGRGFSHEITEIAGKISRLQRQGRSVLLFADYERLLGMIAVRTGSADHRYDFKKEKNCATAFRRRAHRRLA